VTVMVGTTAPVTTGAVSPIDFPPGAIPTALDRDTAGLRVDIPEESKAAAKSGFAADRAGISVMGGLWWGQFFVPAHHARDTRWNLHRDNYREFWQPEPQNDANRNRPVNRQTVRSNRPSRQLGNKLPLQACLTSVDDALPYLSGYKIHLRSAIRFLRSFLIRSPR
jgi:hypothetical protein